MTNNNQKLESNGSNNKVKSQAKKDKLAVALRENLKRRKAPAPVSDKENNNG